MNLSDTARIWASYPVLWTPRLSADGQWLAWTWTGLTETGNVWVVPTDGSRKPRRLTDGGDHFFVNHVSADGGTLILSQSIGANEHDRLFLLEREGTAEPRPLTALQSNHYVFGGALSPDGRFLVYAADVDHESGEPTAGSWIYRQDLASGERLVLARAESVAGLAPEISPDGSSVLYARSDRHPAGVQYWVVGMDGNGDREILTVGDRLKAKAHWLGEGDKILVLAETETHDRVGVLEAGTGSLRWLIDDPARAIDDILPGSDGRRAMVLEFAQGRLVAKLLDIASGGEQPFVSPGRSLLPIGELPDGSWVAEAYHSGGAHELVRVDPATGAKRNLTDTAATIAAKPDDFTAASNFTWHSSDGRRIQGWLYEPKVPSRGLVCWVHGGPTWHSEDWVNPVIQFLVGAGFTVLDPNYRGSTGFGRDFRESIKEDGWGGREQLDIRAGIEALLAASKAKRGRIGVAGLSYGGYSSWFAITRFADLVDAAVPICGMYELGIDYHATEMPHGRAYSEEMMGGTPEDLPERYHNASPANFIDQIKGRLLIVHGMADSNVSPENTRRACLDLARAGIPFELVTFDDEGHGIYKFGNRRQLLERMATFFNAAFA